MDVEHTKNNESLLVECLLLEDGWLVGWLVVWLVGLVGWLLGWFIDVFIYL
jgi:cell division protein FtsX